MVFQKCYNTLFLTIFLSALVSWEDKRGTHFELSENHIIKVIIWSNFSVFCSKLIQQVELILTAMKIIVLIEKYSIFAILTFSWNIYSICEPGMKICCSKLHLCYTLILCVFSQEHKICIYLSRQRKWHAREFLILRGCQCVLQL